MQKENEKDPQKHYNFERVLRDTLFGRVHAASNNSGRFAIKESQKDLARRGQTVHGAAVLENVIEETRILTLLNKPSHENVLRLVENFEFGNRYWTVLEYVGGGECFDYVVSQGRIPNKQAKVYFRQLLSGLTHIHSRGICHLDLSLENLLMRDDYSAIIICDFGLAREFTPNEPYPAVRPGQPKPGKLGYMAPELYHGQVWYGPAADMYSCGIILFMLLTGIPPYERPSQDDQRFNLIFRGDIRKLLTHWKLINLLDPAAISLMAELICPIDRRLNLEAVKAHKWLLSD